MRYRLELDDKGRRCWVCEHDSGEREPLPAEFALQFRAEPWEVDGKQTALPIGTVVEMTMPEDQVEAERQALLRVLRGALQANARREGGVLSDADADELVQRILRDAKATRDPTCLQAMEQTGIDPPKVDALKDAVQELARLGMVEEV
jgi:hypothetical protein